MGFNTEDRKVYDILNDRMYSVDLNQRKYVWNSNNWREMLEDIDLVYSKKVHEHFIGSVVLKKETISDSIRNHFAIIDGQQRISTLTIALCSLAFLFAERGEYSTFHGFEKQLFVSDNRKNLFPIVSEKANKSISVLVKELFSYARKCETGGEAIDFAAFVSSNKSIEKSIRECFLFFSDELSRRAGGETDPIGVLDTYKEIICDIRCIEIIADEDENAYSIFEVLNARGQALKDYELLKNYIFRHSADCDKEKVKDALAEIENMLSAEDIEWFLKHYTMHRYGVKTDKTEKRPYKVIAKQEKETVNDLIDDLKTKATYYKKMIDYTNCTDTEKKVFSFFKPRNQRQFRPLVLGLMHQRDIGMLSDDDYEEQLTFLYEFFVCYHVIGDERSNKLEDIVDGYSHKFEVSFSNEELCKFKQSMANRIPSKENFTNSIRRIRYSHKYKAYSDKKKRENATAILELIELELGYEGSFDNLTIEHVNPDALTEDNAHVGNLILLEQKLNEKCKNLPLDQKLQYYDKSGLKLPHMVAKKIRDGERIEYDANCDWMAKMLYERIKVIQEQ